MLSGVTERNKASGSSPMGPIQTLPPSDGVAQTAGHLGQTIRGRN
jgi:hypothetical protein